MIASLSLGKTDASRLPSVDALRGIAAVSVMLFHAGGKGLPKLQTDFSQQLTSWGWAGVEMFFVISGFVLPYVMHRTGYRLDHAGNFLFRRFVRIWPPAAFLIALTIAQFWLISHVVGSTDVERTDLSIARIASNFALVATFFDERWLNGVLWTLAIEFQFYVFLALLFPVVVRGGTAAFVILLGTLTMPWWRGAMTAQFLLFAPFFSAGFILFLVHLKVTGRNIALLLFTACFSVTAVNQGLVATTFGAIAVAAIAWGKLTWRPLLWLGTISYSLYLVHIIVISTVEFAYLKIVWQPDTASRYVGILICIFAAIFAAAAYYRLIEAPFIRRSQNIGPEARPRTDPGL